MENQVELSIVLPSGEYLKENAASVLLPAVRADVDILPERAPSIFVLDYGVLQILNADGTPKKRYFIKSGTADVAANKCLVMTSEVVPFDDVSATVAQQKLENADNDDDRLFYQMILNQQKGIRRRYLRTFSATSQNEGKVLDYDSFWENVSK